MEILPYIFKCVSFVLFQFRLILSLPIGLRRHLFLLLILSSAETVMQYNKLS